MENAFNSYNLNVSLILDCEVMLKGLENFLHDLHFVRSISIYKDFQNFTLTEKSDLLVFCPEKDSDYTAIEEIIQSNPSVKTILISSDMDLKKNFIFAKKNELNALVSNKIEFPDFFNIVQKVRSSKNKHLICYPEYVQEEFDQNQLVDFSSREIDVLHYIALGKTNAQIANILRLSTKTIETHRRRMIERMESNNIIPVILYAHKNNFIPKGG